MVSCSIEQNIFPLPDSVLSTSPGVARQVARMCVARPNEPKAKEASKYP